MNREMVIASKGRPPKKIREKDGEIEYEEWIYGEPPQDVDFVRLVGDEVVRLESMKVNGEKIVHTEREVDLPPTVAKSSSEPEVRPPNAPSLRRPGEEIDTASPAGGRAPTPGPPPDPLGQGGPEPLPNRNVGASALARAESHHEPRGDSRPGCPVERSSTEKVIGRFAPAGQPRAAVRHLGRLRASRARSLAPTRNC